MDEQLPELELVGGGLAEWPSGQGPRGESIAPAAFVNAEGHADLLALPHRFRESGADGWECSAGWQNEPLALLVQVRTPVEASFRILLNPARHGPLVDAMLRDGTLYICPTSPRHGINARLARDHSFFCAVDQDFVPHWRAIRGRR